MITFRHGAVTSVYRSAAVIVNEGRILLHRAQVDPFWSLPGGKVELLEPSAEALVREIREEMAAEIEIIRLLWIVENFFVSNNGQQHELGLYYLAQFAPGDQYRYAVEQFEGNEHQLSEPIAELTQAAHTGLRLTFQWFAQEVNSLANLAIQPKFLCSHLAALPEHTIHIVTSVNTDQQP